MTKFTENIHLNSEPFNFNFRALDTLDFQGYYHSHQGCELLLIHQGKGRVIVNQHAYEIQPGMLFYFQPFQLHKVRADINPEFPYERSVIHFEPTVFEPQMQLFPKIHSFFLHLWHDMLTEQAYDLKEQNNYLISLFEQFSQHIEHLSNKEKLECVSLFLMQIVQCLGISHLYKSSSINKTNPRTLKYSEKIMQWLEKHYAEEFKLDTLAEALHLSKFYVSRVFQQETGSSITDYLTARRIKQACWLLNTTSLPIERIGIEVGIQNPPYFCQLFKKNVGRSPHKYRSKNI